MWVELWSTSFTTFPPFSTLSSSSSWWSLFCSILCWCLPHRYWVSEIQASNKIEGEKREIISACERDEWTPKQAKVSFLFLTSWKLKFFLFFLLQSPQNSTQLQSLSEDEIDRRRAETQRNELIEEKFMWFWKQEKRIFNRNRYLWNQITRAVTSNNSSDSLFARLNPKVHIPSTTWL